MHEIKLRPRQIHVLVWVLRLDFEVMTPDVYIVLENAVLSVRQNDEHDRKLMVGCGPERLETVHR